MKGYFEYMDELRRAAREVGRSPQNIAMQARILNSSYPTLGLPTPVVKAAARSVPLCERKNVLDGFFSDQSKTYDGVLFASCLAAKKGDYAETRELLARIIPLYGSWAHVDSTVPLLRWTDADAFLGDFEYLLHRPGEYETRTYIIYMLSRCITEERVDRTLEIMKGIDYGRYYVDMGAAWLLAEALVKFYDRTVPLFEHSTFPPFVHDKALQKARESLRVTDEVKKYLLSLKTGQRREK